MFWCQHLSGASYFTSGALSQEAISVWMQSCSVFRLLLVLSFCHFIFFLRVLMMDTSCIYKPLWIDAAEACFSLFSRSPPSNFSRSSLHWSYCSSSIMTPFSFMWFFTLSSIKFLFGGWLFLWYYCFERCKCCKNMYIIFRVVGKALCDDEYAMFLHRSLSVCSLSGLALWGCVSHCP